MTWWRTPVEDPARKTGAKTPDKVRGRRSRRSAEAKGPDEERKGIQAGIAEHGEVLRSIRLVKLQGSP